MNNKICDEEPMLQMSDSFKSKKAIAVLAPSSDLAAVFPELRQQGIRRLEELLGIPARIMNSARITGKDLTSELRAADLNEAFGDTKIIAIVCTIGGDDSIRVLPYLNSELITRNPKPLLGYSDITSLHLFLFKLGVPSLYGGALLTQFAISGQSMHQYTADAIRHALLQPEKPMKIEPSKVFQDGYLEFADSDNLTIVKPPEINPGWEWVGWVHGEKSICPIDGVLWGGCLETLFGHLAIRKYLLEVDKYKKTVLFVETSEDFPSECTVYTFFQSLGEIGILQSLSALLVGRPVTVNRDTSPQVGRQAYRQCQRRAILRAIDEYCPKDSPLPVVFGLDFGHTDPQVLVPYGGRVTIDPDNQSIIFHYRHNGLDFRNVMELIAKTD